jgi:hypothetical protein
MLRGTPHRPSHLHSEHGSHGPAGQRASGPAGQRHDYCSMGPNERRRLSRRRSGASRDRLANRWQRAGPQRSRGLLWAQTPMTPPTITPLALDGEKTRPSDDAVAADLSIEVVHPTAVTATSRRGMNQRNNGPLLPTCHARITSTLWIQALEIAHVRTPRVRVLDRCRVNRPSLNTISVLEHDHSGVASRERRCRGHVRTFGGPKGPGHTLTSISALVSRSSVRSC